jgi:heterodisulfide reductase subunit A
MAERVGVFVCHCGSNIAGTVDVEAVVEHARKLKDVAVAQEFKYMCSDTGQGMIKKAIKDSKLTRVVVAACSPTLHEPTFRRACADAGLNAFLFQMANIREQCSWVTEDKEQATAKAERIVTAAVRRVVSHEPLQIKEAPVTPAVMVVGAGITGIEAALRIADSGKKVYLVEKEATIGGMMARFDKTFPTLDCAACILTPKMTEVKDHPNIELMTYCEVKEVSGYVGNFKVRVLKKPRYVIQGKCNNCGECAKVCPVVVRDEFDCGLSTRRAIHIPFAQAVPSLYVLDSRSCLGLDPVRCTRCHDACEAKAIDYEMQPQVVEIPVGAIILATGYELFDCARLSDQYGYGRFPDVYTSLEFERLCHASGPTGGKIVCADGREPESIAILHCVGSRDEKHNDYCSRVCCMYSLKFAHLVKEKTKARVTNFYIDMRAFGKGYEEFYRRCLHEGMDLVRGKGAEVTDVAESRGEEGKLVVRCEDTLLGGIRRIPADMVILSAGLSPRKGTHELARTFGISRSTDGFFMERHPKLAPVSTASDGIYVAGACQGPKDIPDCVAQGAAAAAAAVSLIDAGRIKLEPIAAEIEEALCSGCRMCVAICPYNAVEYDAAKKKSRINEALCKGCGTCVATCASGAARQKGFTDLQIFSEIEGVLCVKI